MIDRVFSHLPGIGPETERRLRNTGIATWSDLCGALPILRMPENKREELGRLLERHEHAIRHDDIGFFLQQFKRRDHWTILDRYFEDACFFDIETAGEGGPPIITVIACLDSAGLHTFVAHENLDDFLSHLDRVKLLVSYNGDSFDVPQVLRHFHIPVLPCPHLDLRWVCHHEGLKGGLKAVERQADIRRPGDLDGLDGRDAVWLWERWDISGERPARDRLVRYCGADAVSLKGLAALILRSRGSVCALPETGALWALLPPPADTHQAPPAPRTVESATPSDRRERLRAAMKRMRKH